MRNGVRRGTETGIKFSLSSGICVCTDRQDFDAENSVPTHSHHLYISYRLRS